LGYHINITELRSSTLCYGLGYGISQLEKFYGRPILEADRHLVVEQNIEKLLEDAHTPDIALLVVGALPLFCNHT
jgi:diphthamide biosynthesis methyltransferase